MATASQSDGALRGRVIAVTRPLEQSGDLVTELESAGAAVHLAPLIRTEVAGSSDELCVQVGDPAMYEWIIFTSTNAVRHFFGLEVARSLDWAAAGAPKVACVGPATAAAVTAFGVPVEYLPERHESDALGAIAGRGRAGQRVLFPRAEVASRDFVGALQAAGLVVDEVVLYRTVAERQTAAALRRTLESGEIDVLTFTSPSAVRSLLTAGRPERLPAVAVIGPTTAEAVRAAGLPVQIEPTEHSIQGLVRALCAAVRDGRIPAVRHVSFD